MSHIPRGFAAVTPYLLLEDAAGFIEFAKDAFGAKERMNHTEDGRVVHAELEIEGSIIEIGTPSGEFAASQAGFHLFVEDPDAVIAKAIECGAKELYPVTDHEYGERSGGIVDAWGIQWYVACVTDADRRAR